MLRQLEKLRLNDNFGGGFGQNQRYHTYVYEEYKTYGKLQQKEEEEDKYRFGQGRRHEQMMLKGNHRPRFRHGPVFKGVEEEEEENEYFGKRQNHLMVHRPSPMPPPPPLKYKAPVAEEEEEEEEEYEVDDEVDYRARLRQYKMEHQGNAADFRQQPPLQYKAPPTNRKSSDEKERYIYQSTQQFNQERPSTPPPKNNKLNTDGWRGGREESHRDMQYADKFVAPEIFTRMVFVRPSPGQGRGGASVERKWKEPVAAMGNWRAQQGGYMESKWVHKGL